MEAPLVKKSPRAITFGGFSLTAEGLTVKGKPEFGDWENALAATAYLEEKSSFWKADLLQYATTRPDWEGLLDAVIDAGTFTKRTIDQYRYVSKNVPKEDRVEGLSFSHHAEVASLPSGDKRIFLKKAKAEHLSVAELKAAVRKGRHVRILKGQASELAALMATVRELANDAALACRTIPISDGKHGLQRISDARALLDDCEVAVQKLWKAQGKRK